jgi:hypothetical protein|tara:strand:+ start:700 stop:1023 length:324 start_codon:yes stop_codon:yes gene_type:complete
VDPATRYLALAVVLRAVRDMQKHGAKNTTAPTEAEYHDAMIWLGSRQAALWFDGASVSQYSVLWANDWMKYAEEMLDSCELLPEERRLLEDGVRVFGVLKDRYDKGS